MVSFPYFKTRFSREVSANPANCAKRQNEISTFSHFSHEREQFSNIVDFLEAYEERAAIMEYDAGLSRADAETAAFKDLIIKDKQNDD